MSLQFSAMVRLCATRAIICVRHLGLTRSGNEQTLPVGTQASNPSGEVVNKIPR